MDKEKYFHHGEQGRAFHFFQQAGWLPTIYPCADGAEIIVFSRDGLEVELFPEYMRVTEEKAGLFLTASSPYSQIEISDGVIRGRDEGFRSAFRVEAN